MDGWYARQEKGDRCQNLAFPWHPALGVLGGPHFLDVWFESEAACVRFIEARVAGHGLIIKEAA